MTHSDNRLRGSHDPDFLVGQLTLAAAAAPPATHVGYFTVFVFGIIILVPSLLLLYRTFRGDPELPQ